MKNFKNIVITLIVLALFGMSAVSCNTFKGAGQDIQKGGQAVENAAEGAQN